MQFPVYLDVFGLSVHPHPVFEALSYCLGFQVYLWLRKRWPKVGPSLPSVQATWVVVGAICGAALGAKVLALLEWLPELWPRLNTLEAWVGEKTIVGGILGGWIGVEIAKRAIGAKHSTGDAMILPLLLGIAIGRIGCFLTGPDDRTWGGPTTFPLGIDAQTGAGPLHPTPLYEIAFVLLLAAALGWRMRRPWRNGSIFRLGLVAYLAFRLGIDMLKPRIEVVVGLSAIQLACVVGLALVVRSWWRLRLEPIVSWDTSAASQHHV